MKSAMRAALAAVLVLAVGMPMSTSFAEAKGRTAASRKAKKPKRVRAIVVPKPDPGFLARDAYYSGEIQKAYELAPAAGERWIAALAAWRLGKYDEALTGFSTVANDLTGDAWLRSGAAFWAARAAVAAGAPEQQDSFLRAAAATPWTFYGMIAEAQLGLNPVVSFAQAVTSPELLAAEALDPVAQLIRASSIANDVTASSMAPIADIPGFNPAHYPVPALAPEGGFTIDAALVYALIRQESRFNPTVVSPVGAVGLMQLMPSTAAITGGDARFKDREVLRDPAVNMRLGQDYMAMLANNLVGDDMLMVIAAYNGGPGAVTKTMDRVGWGADPLLMIESLPAKETRDYVEKVMAGYWIYRRQFGQETPSLAALASGAKSIGLSFDRNGGQTVVASANVSLTNAVANVPASEGAALSATPEPIAEAASFTVGQAF